MSRMDGKKTHKTHPRGVRMSQMSELTRDPVSLDQILRRERRQVSRKLIFRAGLVIDAQSSKSYVYYIQEAARDSDKTVRLLIRPTAATATTTQYLLIEVVV